MPLSTSVILFRLILAIFVGGVIGSERENKNSPAGFKTHILVCVGTTVISLITIEMLNESIYLANETNGAVKFDLARLGAQAITGIGFLGAGTIMHSKGLVRGLTTAATLWVVAIIGLAGGMGYYRIAFLGTMSIFTTLVILKEFQKKYITRPKIDSFEIYFEDEEKIMSHIESYFESHNIIIEKIEKCVDPSLRFSKNESGICGNRYSVHLPQYINVSNVLEDITKNPNIIKVRYRGDVSNVNLMN
ncbi:MgtC/SapB family protein [Enterococcus sp.]|uniref:MgtC/SapB family protein n=1 Tax=Enterococcus sp. TaxID=35783 RepID=UPI002FC8B244